MPASAASAATAAAASPAASLVGAPESHLRGLLQRTAERRARRAVAAARPDCSAAERAELLYAHARALRVCNDVPASASRLLEVLAAEPAHELAAYWLRVALAGSALPAPLAARIRLVLLDYSGTDAAGGVGEGAGSSAAGLPIQRGREAGADAAEGADAGAAGLLIPHAYIRKLFDAYAPSFDAHLTGVLHYDTPALLVGLALRAAAAVRGDIGSATPTRRAWRRCADLGCGTGLAAAALRPLCDALIGIDLSEGMLAQARAGGAYDALHAESVEGWLEGEAAGAAGAAIDGAAAASALSPLRLPADLLIAADVLVYVGDLRRLMTAAAAVLRLAAAGSSDGTADADSSLPLPLFAFSTETLEASAAATTGSAASAASFRLLPSGRCAHAREYVVRLAAEAGLAVLTTEHRRIRCNAGTDVFGDLYVCSIAERSDSRTR